MKKPAVLIITATSTLALASAIGLGVAQADPAPSPGPTASSTPTPSTAPTRTPRQAGAQHRNLAQRGLHGDITLTGKNHRQITFQRGTISALTNTSISVLSPDGFKATYVIDAETKIRARGKKAARSDLDAGDHLRVLATRTGSTLTATRITDRQR